MTRQQEFIRKAISKAVSRGLTNPGTLNELVDVGVDHVGLDPSLDAGDIVDLGRRFASFDADSLHTFGLPATPFRTAGGASVLELEEREAERIFNTFRGVPPGELTPSLVEVTVLNGIGEPGLAHDISVAFEEIGFAVGTPGDTDEPATTTTIWYAPGDEAAGQLVARHVTGPVAFGTDEDLAPGEVYLVAGPDFTTLHEQPSPTVPSIPTTTTTTGDDRSTRRSTTTTTVVGYVPDSAPETVGCG
jgi:hypothetical protein